MKELEKLAKQIKKMNLKGKALSSQIEDDLEALEYDDDEFEQAYKDVLRMVKESKIESFKQYLDKE